MTTLLQQAFYEVQSIKNNWSVCELKCAIESLLYERTRLSADKTAVSLPMPVTSPLAITSMVKSPYVLGFLGLEKRPFSIRFFESK